MKVCGMSMEQWNDIEERAHRIHRTWKCKKIDCKVSMWGKEYGINEGDILKKEHVIAVLIFCTFDTIRNEFLLTFNQYYHTALLVEDRINDSKNGKIGTRQSGKHRAIFSTLFSNERGIELMKKNHSYFVNFAKLLRECVECFGSKLNGNLFGNFNNNDMKMGEDTGFNGNKNKSFYFGLNNAMGLFKKTLNRIKLPLLCSSSMSVTLNHMECMEDDGLLIEVKYYDPFIRYFDCSWITEYIAEQEILFNGGISILKIETIFNVATDTNYLIFVRSMNILQSMLNGSTKKEVMTTFEEQIIRYLVQNEFIRAMNNDTDVSNNINGKSIIPNYISLLFHHFCINLKSISINLGRMNDQTYHGYHNIKSLFLTSQNNFIKLDVLCSLFPNVPTIKIIGHPSHKKHCIKLDELFFEEVLLILDSNLISKKCSLSKIMIGNADEQDMTLEQAIAKYGRQFEQKYCKMKIKVRTRELVIERPNMSNGVGLHHSYQVNQGDHNGHNQGCLIQ